MIALSFPPSPALGSTPFIIYLECDYFCAMNWLKNKKRISRQDLLEMLKRIDRAYRIVELNEKEPMILETNRKDQLFEVRSSKDKGRFYRVDADIKICTCPDFNFRFLKCKHIIAAEFASGITS
jgi:SWIM zinc finger